MPTVESNVRAGVTERHAEQSSIGDRFDILAQATDMTTTDERY